MRPTVCGGIAIVFAAVALFGQQNHAPGEAAADSLQINDLRERSILLLSSTSPRDRAWGAYLAGKYGFREHISLLVWMLDDQMGNRSAESVALQLVLLDGLIQLEARVPETLLTRVHRSFPDQAIILFAKAPKENAAALLSVLNDSMPEAQWLAIGNLLTETKAKGFCGFLLRGMRVVVSVAVFDNPNRGSGEGGGCGSGVGCGGHLSASGFPPVMHYRLTENPSRGAVVVAPGTHPIFYVRSPDESTLPSELDFGMSCESLGRDRFRTEYLATMLATTAQSLEFDPRPHYKILWQNTDQYLTDLTRIRKEVEHSCSGLVNRLLASRLLTASDPFAAAPSLSFVVSDFRENRTVPLPELP